MTLDLASSPVSLNERKMWNCMQFSASDSIEPHCLDIRLA